MRGGKWQSWAVLMTLGLALGFGAPVQAAAPEAKKAPVVKSETEREEILRLVATLDRLKEQGNFHEAIPLAERLLVIREKAVGPDDVSVAMILNNLGTLYEQQAEHVRAERLHLRALAIREKAYGPAHLDVSDSLNNLANVYSDMEDYARAEPIYQRVLEIREKALGSDHADVADALNNLGFLYKKKGDYAQAEALYLRALTIYEQEQGPGYPHFAYLLSNLGRLYKSTGNYTRAEAYFLRALAIHEQRPDHPNMVPLLDELAMLSLTRFDIADAEKLQRRAIRILEEAFGPRHPQIAGALHNLANIRRMGGDGAGAEQLLRRSVEILEKGHGPEHPKVAEALNNLAILVGELGDHAQATSLFERVLGILEKVYGPEHPYFIITLGNLSRSYAEEDRLEQAIESAQRTTDLADRHALVQLSTGSEEQKRLYLRTLDRQTTYNFALHLQYAPKNANAARLALTTALRSKGRLLETMTGNLATLRQSLATEDQVLVDRLGSVYSKLATQLSRDPGAMFPEVYRKNIAELETERQKLEAEIGMRSSSFRLEKRLVTMKVVQAALPSDAALLEIVQYKTANRMRDVPWKWLSRKDTKPRYAAYVLQSTGEPSFVDLGDVAPIDAAIESFRQALADPDLTHDPKPAARRLDQLLMQPIRKLLGNTRWVFVSGDGATHLVPFAALVDENNHYLVERYLFSYVNTGRDLLRFVEKPISSREAPLVLANPSFDESGAPPAPEAKHRGVRSIDMVTQRLLPLRSTADEAQGIRTFFPESRVLTGSAATEETLKTAHAPRFLHLATHGFFLPEQPVPDALLRNENVEPTLAERAAILQRENPLLRSGIALAGFNKRRSGIDDGVLTALEAAGLDLHGTRLVVLSACETGLGRATSGEGVYGLRRALSMAGAETQVMSLWPVDTGRTRELMQSYYQRLKGKGGRSDSMRNVQLAMLSNPETSHPNLWASFIVSGDWRALEGEATLPEIKVHKGPRGCACSQAGESNTADGAAWLSITLGLLAMGRKRRVLPKSMQFVGGASRGTAPNLSHFHSSG